MLQDHDNEMEQIVNGLPEGMRNGAKRSGAPLTVCEMKYDPLSNTALLLNLNRTTQWSYKRLLREICG